MTTFRERLRALPVLPDGLPGWEIADLDALPATPHQLFETWFDETVAAGATGPHAMTLSTSDGHGAVRARTVILKDLTADGWWFAGHSTSPKGRDLATEPRAALTFLWRETGRQVRVTGAVTSHPEVGAADFLARPDASRAAGLVDHQSEVLGDLAEHRKAWADALDRVRADPRLIAPAWTAWCLTPYEVEFWQSGTGTGQTRLRYRPDATMGAPRAAWTKELLWP
ncbi:pyridoxamine 5'-phosphate oxidase [Isoptericola sp. CG 20/1183]|uniref:Pyridoxamine 5'-phosphate oxidase n=1 Tax=Isoptericola halotolerans TaxID=300560 RepID=A0ABX5EC16_9MICO|nr:MULTISPECIES: pyridoxamine 5'-phosphate oxidase family protein [Isoptericola]PRZ05113.1 pyridoxamine 5'-phosphate oxidase [Isoptericola halotolerans]PRZ05851.1 pyridoxamine 5'-phosphate oxidase [Isoptericola sp. CG 20/1183]